MSSWLPFIFSSFQPPQTQPQPQSPPAPHSQPSTPIALPSRRFPLPPTRAPHSISLSPEDTTGGRKRERGWIPRSMSSDRVPGTSDGVGNAASASMSNQRAEGAFDTPRSYIAAAAAGGSSSRRDDAMDWNPREEAQDGEGVGAEESEQPPSKKRKGLAGVVLSGALDAAIFTTALTYSAYQLWKNPPSAGNEDIESLLQMRSRARPTDPPPPPYAEHAPARATPPSQIPRRVVRHAHPPRPRPSARKSTSHPPPPSSIASTSFLPSAPGTAAFPPDPDPDPDPFFRSNLLPHPLPQFHPFHYSPGTDAAEPEEEEEEDDPEMQAVADRLKSLIEAGRDALLSKPPTVGGATAAEEEEDIDGARPLPQPVSLAMARGGGGGGSAPGHRRRQSAGIVERALGDWNSPRSPIRGGRKSFDGLGRATGTGHARGTSLGGSSGAGGGAGGRDARVREWNRDREDRQRENATERGNVKVLQVVLDRASQNSGKGWWEN